MRSNALCTALVCLLALPAQAVELHPMSVRKGMQGLDRVSLSVSDRTARPIVCHAELAHWYSVPPTRIEPGGAATIQLRVDARTGTYYVPNVKHENMVLETVWCGFAREAYETRALIALDRSRAPQARYAVTCALHEARLLCR